MKKKKKNNLERITPFLYIFLPSAFSLLAWGLAKNLPSTSPFYGMEWAAVLAVWIAAGITFCCATRRKGALALTLAAGLLIWGICSFTNSSRGRKLQGPVNRWKDKGTELVGSTMDEHGSRMGMKARGLQSEARMQNVDCREACADIILTDTIYGSVVDTVVKGQKVAVVGKGFDADSLPYIQVRAFGPQGILADTVRGWAPEGGFKQSTLAFTPPSPAEELRGTKEVNHLLCQSPEAPFTARVVKVEVNRDTTTILLEVESKRDGVEFSLEQAVLVDGANRVRYTFLSPPIYSASCSLLLFRWEKRSVRGVPTTVVLQEGKKYWVTCPFLGRPPRTVENIRFCFLEGVTGRFYPSHDYWNEPRCYVNIEAIYREEV